MLSAPEQQAYYKAALACLRFIENRRPTKRRFGPEADARWKAFKGHLNTPDRIDLLLRDANAEWPGAFGARNVFGLAQAAEDEAFGAQWTSLDGVAGDELWRAVLGSVAPASPAQALQAIAGEWGLKLGAFAVAKVEPTDRILAAGPSAIAALAEAFVGRSELDWAEQVTCVATPAAHRQLALGAIAIVDGHKPARVLSSSETLPALSGAKVVRSDDAAREDLAALDGSQD